MDYIAPRRVCVHGLKPHGSSAASLIASVLGWIGEFGCFFPGRGSKKKSVDGGILAQRPKGKSVHGVVLIIRSLTKHRSKQKSGATCNYQGGRLKRKGLYDIGWWSLDFISYVINIYISLP